MIDVRCKNCNKILAKALVFVGAIKCSRCKMIFEYSDYASMYQASSYTKSSVLRYKDTAVIIKSETTESILPKQQ